VVSATHRVAVGGKSAGGDGEGRTSPPLAERRAGIEMPRRAAIERWDGDEHLAAPMITGSREVAIRTARVTSRPPTSTCR
jgi:hypothetical protein